MASSIDASTSGAGGVITTADNTGILQLKTAGTTAVTVDASQNVGIGTTSPGYRLDTRASAGVGIQFLETSSGSTNRIQLGAGSGLGYINADAGSGSIALAMQVAGTERMRIDSSGNVLVGTTSTNGTGWTIYGSAALGYAVSQGATSTFTHISFQTSGSQKGYIQTVGATTNYNGSSDYRLKENIEVLPNALDIINTLKPVKFNWKLDGSEGYSFIAHELQEVVPQAVGGKKDEIDEEGNPVYQGIDQSKLVAILTKAIQEQQTIINDLKARVTALEAK